MLSLLPRAAVLLLLPALLALNAAGCGATHVSGPAAVGATATPATAEPPTAESKVTIDNFTFSPPTLTVTAGTKVTWVNHDDVPHTATSTAKPKAFDSGTLDTDQQFSHVFTTPGTYDYFCAVHPKMTGRIIVK
jgi:plastocyanin